MRQPFLLLTLCFSLFISATAFARPWTPEDERRCLMPDCGAPRIPDPCEGSGDAACRAQACDHLVVNSTDPLYRSCYEGHCTLLAAYSKALTCGTDQTITFATLTAIENTTTTLHTSAADTNHRITIDGGASRFIFRVVAPATRGYAFIVNRDKVTLKNLVFQNFTNESIRVLNGVNNFDLFNISSTSTSATAKPLGYVDEASADNSGKNEPTFVHQIGTGTEYALYAVLPVDSKLYVYSTTGSDLQSVQMNLNDAGTETYTALIRPVKDNRSTDYPAHRLYAWRITGARATSKIYLLRKDNGKNVVLDQVIDGLCSDDDGDGLCNRYETAFGSNPSNADSDGDGRTDFQEAVLFTGSDVYPLSTDLNFIALDSDNNGTSDLLQAASAAPTPPAPSSSSTSSEAGGCTMMEGVNSSSPSSWALLFGTLGTVGILGRQRWKLRKK